MDQKKPAILALITSLLALAGVGVDSDDVWRQSAPDLNSEPAVTNTIYQLALRPNASNGGSSQARSGLGPFANRSRFSKTLPGKIKMIARGIARMLRLATQVSV
jgi:hypothetical protein